MLRLVVDTFKSAIVTTEYAISYNQIRFLVFLGFFLAVYFLLWNNSLKKIWILLGNLFFCVWSGWAGIIIVAVTAVITFICSLQIEKIYDRYEEELAGKQLKPKEQVLLLGEYKKKARIYLWIAMFFILAVWIFVKICKFIHMPAVASFGEVFSGKGIIVPLGISYYTLSAVGYLLDNFWRKAKPVHSFLDLFIVMTYFPHIIQGPISKYSKLLPAFDHIPAFDYDRVCFGLQLTLWGYVKKMIIADSLIKYTQTIFGDLTVYAGLEVFFAVLLSGIQLYADFSGCMDIVRGISHAMGIDLDPNFNQPFFSRSSSEFWTRWHMTLNAWTKEYIFLAIAMHPDFMKKIRSIKKTKGARVSSFWNSFVPLLSVWLFTGLWHGTGVDYILWGLYWCALMTLSKELSPVFEAVGKKIAFDGKKWYWMLWQIIRTYMIFVIGKCFTAAGGLSGFVLIWQRVFSEIRFESFLDGTIFTYGLDKLDFIVAVFFVLLLLGVDILHEKGVNIRRQIARAYLPVRWSIYIAAIMAVVIFGVYGAGFDASKFVYGGF